MNQIQQLRLAIAKLWPELPNLLGHEWPQFMQKVLTLLAQLDSAPNDATAEEIYYKLHRLFFEYEQVDARLQKLLVDNALESMLISKSIIDTRGGGYREDDTVIGDELVAHDHNPQATLPSITVTRYTDIACPGRVWVKTPRITVVVRLTAQRSDYSAVIEPVELRTDLPVQVRLGATAFTVLNAAYQSTMVSAIGDTAPLVFDLAPTTVGHTTLIFDFLQGGNPLRTVTVPIEVTAQPVEETRADRVGVALALRTDRTPPDLLLHIGWDEQSKTLEFTLLREGGAWWRTFPPVSLTGDPSTYAAALYQKITTLVHNEDPTLQAVFQYRRQIPAADVDRRIKQLGQNLWAELIPTELKQLYLAEREAWQGKTLLLWCDEPHIPWELVWPYDNRYEDDSPWCATLRLTRWLRRDARGNGNEGAPTTLDLGALSILAPTYTILSNLAFAQRERQQLLALMQQYQLRDTSPAEPTWGAVMDLLEAGGYQWLHVAAHGNFYPQSPDGDSALWLAADMALTPDAIVGAATERYLHSARPGFFFNACEVGRQGWALTRLGGWANRLISAGAGLFIGPHWEVRDDSALTFAATFYQRLLQGDTVAEATYQARLAARKAGDPTWLAYSVYAHPNARISHS